MAFYVAKVTRVNDEGDELQCGMTVFYDVKDDEILSACGVVGPVDEAFSRTVEIGMFGAALMKAAEDLQAHCVAQGRIEEAKTVGTSIKALSATMTVLTTCSDCVETLNENAVSARELSDEHKQKPLSRTSLGLDLARDITVRDLFIASALSGIMTQATTGYPKDKIADECFELADACCKRRAKGQSE